MDSNKFLAKEKKVAGTTKVKVIKIDYLDPEYKIEEFSNKRGTNTGLVEVAKLFPQNPNLPTFLFRWDEKEDVVDVDICKNGQRRNKLWREKGYEGHRPQKTIGEGRIFEADISIPNKKIFKGKIDVGLFIELTIKDFGNGIDSIRVVHKQVKIEDAGRGIDDINVETEAIAKMGIKRLWDSLSLNLAAIIIAIVVTVYFATRSFWYTLISTILVVLVLKYEKNKCLQ